MQPKLIGGNNKSFRHQFWLHRAAITVAPYERPLISAFNIALNWWAGLCTEKTSIPFPFTLNYIWSWGQFSFRFSEPKGFPFGSKSKGILSPRSYLIQFERKWNTSFLSVLIPEAIIVFWCKDNGKRFLAVFCWLNFYQALSHVRIYRPLPLPTRSGANFIQVLNRMKNDILQREGDI